MRVHHAMPATPRARAIMHDPKPSFSKLTLLFRPSLIWLANRVGWRDSGRVGPSKPPSNGWPWHPAATLFLHLFWPDIRACPATSHVQRIGSSRSASGTPIPPISDSELFESSNPAVDRRLLPASGYVRPECMAF